MYTCMPTSACMSIAYTVNTIQLYNFLLGLGTGKTLAVALNTHSSCSQRHVAQLCGKSRRGGAQVGASSSRLCFVADVNNHTLSGVCSSVMLACSVLWLL